jgi:hypothetical protein
LWSLPFRLPNWNFVSISHPSHARYMPRPFHPPSFDRPNNIWWSVQVMKLLIRQCSPASLSGPNVLLSNPFPRPSLGAWPVPNVPSVLWTLPSCIWC